MSKRSKTKKTKTHFRRPNGVPVCGTTWSGARFVEKYTEVTCNTCQFQYKKQREEGKIALIHVVQIGALTEEEMLDILKTAIKEEAIKQVMNA